MKNFDSCINSDIEIIHASESRHAQELSEKGERDVPVGKLGENIEVVFLHYKDPELAKDKWMRRRERINYDNLIFKFSYMNGCTPELMKTFDEMKLPGKKFAFVRTSDEANNMNCGIYYPGFEHNTQIENDTFYWNRSFDVSSFLNKK